jgi:hypothetical protein
LLAKSETMLATVTEQAGEISDEEVQEVAVA